MLVIGELINGMFLNVKEAIQKKDITAIQELAKKQVEAGADILDVNTGPASAEPVETMKWLIEGIQAVTDKPLALDSTKADVIEAGLKLCKKPALINSTTAQKEKLDTLLPLVKQYDASIIALTMDKSGIPRDKDARMEHAVTIVTAAQEAGISMDKVYLDPIVLPVNVAQAQCKELLEALKEFKILSDPPPKTVVGLSNVSQGTNVRNLINRIYLVMGIACGLDAAIVDPLDKDLMDAMITSELLLNKNIYCDAFLEAYRKK